MSTPPTREKKQTNIHRERGGKPPRHPPRSLFAASRQGQSLFQNLQKPDFPTILEYKTCTFIPTNHTIRDASQVYASPRKAHKDYEGKNTHNTAPHCAAFCHTTRHLVGPQMFPASTFFPAQEKKNWETLAGEPQKIYLYTLKVYHPHPSQAYSPKTCARSLHTRRRQGETNRQREQDEEKNRSNPVGSNGVHSRCRRNVVVW